MLGETAQPACVQCLRHVICDSLKRRLISNLVMIHHNPEEFTMHFIYVFTNGTHGKLVASTIVSPGHAKRLWRALGENIARFEAQFGPIRESPTPAPPPNVGFVQ